MGEAVYYIKARFESEEAAEKALPIVTAFLERVRKCEWEFADHRPHDETAKPAWDALKAKYPDVFEGLGIQPPLEDRYGGLNCLADQLNAPPEDEEPWQSGDIIGFSGVVWHFADWSGFEHYFKSIGAVKAAWISDEDWNPFDAIQLD